MAKNVRIDMKKLNQLIADTPDAVDDWLHGVAHTMNGEIVVSMTDSPPGETQTRYKPKRTVQVSQEGNPPRVDIGTLRASMNVERVRRLHYRIQDGVEYGIYLEDVWNRPFMGPVFEAWRRKIAGEFKKSGLLK